MSTQSFFRSLPPFWHRFPRSRAAGRATSAWLISVLIGGCLAACGDDEPAPQTAVDDSLQTPDASVRELPGDGLEPTPDFDVEVRQRTPVGPRRLVETVGRFRDELDTPRSPADPEDAGAPPAEDGSDAGTSASETN